MKSSLDVVFMRRPKFNYTSPAVCEADFSNSASPVIILDPLKKLFAPTGLVLGGTGGFRLSWSDYPGVLCYSIYKAVDELDPFGEYVLIAECVDDNFIDLDDFGDGVYRITAITAEGESEFSDPFTVHIAVPPSEITLELVEMDQPFDFSEDETVIVGYVGVVAAIYKAGVITTHALPGSDFAFFSAVSPDGNWVVGYDNLAGFDHKVSYDFSTYRDLGNDGFGSGLFDVNNSGRALSTSKRIVDTTTGATVVDIPVIYPGAALQADPDHPHSINETDQVVLTDVTNNRIVRYSSGSVSNINPGDWQSRQILNPTYVINNAGHVAATYIDTLTQNRSFFFNGVTSASIGDFGGFVTAKAMSETDWVVGRADNGSSFYGAFRWSPTNALEMLPLIPSMTPGSEGFALDVNDDGWIVGTMDSKAFVYHDGVSIELTSLIPLGSDWSSLDQALFINNLKQVVGYGTYLGVPNRVFLMQLI